MVRYWYGWMPLVVVGTIVFLSLPWLGLIALFVVALVALVALALLVWAMFVVPFRVGRAIGRRWQGRSRPDIQTAPALSPATSSARPTRSAPVPATVLLAKPPSRGDR